jgi:hypothetical protein
MVVDDSYGHLSVMTLSMIRANCRAYLFLGGPVAGIGRQDGVSLGAVFLGAMTYIGTGPNFMVKAIAEQSGIRMPSFFGYMVYSCCVLLPLFLVTALIIL